MNRYIAKFNPAGISKLRQCRVAVSATSMTFWEDTDERASAFVRLYVRNMCRVEFTAEDYSVYAPNDAQPTRFGLLSDPDEDCRDAKPGLANGALSAKQ